MGRPQLNEEEITLRVKVTTDGGRPEMRLGESNFQAIVDDKPVDIEDWRSPTETVPPPAWIVVLIDLSGSMQQTDSSGVTKLQGAIEATRRFIAEMSDRGGDTRVAIVPFGEGGGDCGGYPVTQDAIAARFFPANDIKQQNLLDYLASQTPCASTNIYDPLKQAIRLLGDEENPNFYVPEDSPKPEPRLSVILLSDGYHNKPNEERDFQGLRNLLLRHENIVVHTLGYGLTPEQLGAKYGLGRPATREDIQTAEKPDNPIPDEEFVDLKRLREIAEVSGGVAEFSGDADEIAEALQVFLNALLGEYELVYLQPNAERGSKHEVVVEAKVNGETIQTQSASYTITVFGRSLPLVTRLSMTGVVLLLLGMGGVVPFWKWSQWLKQEAEEDF